MHDHGAGACAARLTIMNVSFLAVEFSEFARQRRAGEDGQPQQEDPPPTEKVGGPPAEQQQTAERQAVGHHDPLQAGLGKCWSRLMLGRATFTIVRSTIVMK